MATVYTQRLLPFALDIVTERPLTPVASQNRLSMVAALPALKQQLSKKASIYLPQDKAFEGAAQRFSNYARPLPGAIVCPAKESDIVSTIRWASAHDVKFLAKAGGHGWSTTLSAIGPDDILMNLRALNKITIDKEKGTATLEAGTTTGELLKAAHNAGVHIVATSCDSVGAIPSIMGAGIGNFVSNFGLGSSEEENSDLFWALRGAGHNFGIISELTVKAHPQINRGLHFSGMLGFPGSREIAEKVIKTVEDMGITEGEGPEGMSCTIVYGRPAPTNEPTVLLKLSFNGPVGDALRAFAPLYRLTNTYPPTIMDHEFLPADEINESKDVLCSEGGSRPWAYRPVHSAVLANFNIPTMGKLYQRWEDFTERNEDARESVVRINCYDYRHVRDCLDDDEEPETAFAWRDRPINVLQYWAYTDAKMHQEIQDLGREFRQALSGGRDASVIMNFASGDERPEAIYGENLQRLREVKDKWDPHGAFSFYNSC